MLGQGGAVDLGECTGAVERLLLATDVGGSVPERVTAALALVLQAEATTGGEAARALSVGDRRQAVRKLLAVIEGPVRWRTGRCGSCGEFFDARVDVTAFPGPPTGTVRARATVELSSGPTGVRVLTGADEEAAVAGGDASTLEARLAQLAVGPDVELTPEDVAAVDDALAELGPSVVTEVATACPECGVNATLPVDPLLEVGRGDDVLLDEVHSIASAYHWAEAEILALPTRRRRQYLRRIDAARGVRS